MVARVKKPDAVETELRRWCIEQSIKWPMQHHPYNAVVSQGEGFRQVEMDIIGRAKRILAWVREQS